MLADSELASDSPMVQQNPNADEIPSPQDAKVSLTFLISSEIVLTCDFQGDRENTPPPRPAEFNPSVTQSSVSRNTATLSLSSSVSRLNCGHSPAGKEEHISMVEIIGRANSAPETPSGIT